MLRSRSSAVRRSGGIERAACDSRSASRMCHTMRPRRTTLASHAPYRAGSMSVCGSEHKMRHALLGKAAMPRPWP